MISVLIKGRTRMVLNIYIISAYRQRAFFILQKLKEILDDDFIFETYEYLRTETVQYKIETLNKNLFDKLRNHHVDQVILDYTYLSDYDIESIKNYLREYSCVPEEFQIINAEEILGIKEEE